MRHCGNGLVVAMTGSFHLGRGLSLAALLLLGACAAPGGRGAPKADGVDPSVAAVQAFAQICARLDRAAVMGQAAQYGFFPPNPGAVPASVAGALAGRGATMLVRPQVGGASLLFWEEVPHCELVPGGVDATAVEAEFERMLQSLASTEGVTLIRATPEQIAQIPTTGPLRPRMVAIAAPNALVPGAGRVFTLLVAPAGTGAAGVAMTTRRVMPSVAPAATQPQGQAKEPQPGRY
jgi:hypothetical protein